jgi:hypothetical protein
MMIRRTLLRAAAAAATLIGLGSAARAQPADQEGPTPPVPDPVFPFPLVTVHGNAALAEWERQRKKPGIWPVVIGSDEDLATIAEGIDDLDEHDVAAILGAAAALDHPEGLRARKRAEDEAARKWLADNGRAGDVEPDHQPELGAWPARVDTGLALTVTEDILKRRPLDRVHIALIPATNGWEAIAHLKWGGWNDNPSAEYHVAALKAWHERYGAELVGLNGDTMNLRVAHRPATREEALDLAREQYLYCADIVDQGVGTLSALAATLMENDWWFFWWD